MTSNREIQAIVDRGLAAVERHRAAGRTPASAETLRDEVRAVSALIEELEIRDRGAENRLLQALVDEAFAVHGPATAGRLIRDYRDALDPTRPLG